MILKIRGLLIAFKAKRHLKKLKELCQWGNGFCESPMYNSKLIQLLNIKINNYTSDISKISFGDFCNVSCQITLNKNGSIKVGDFVFMNFVKMRIDHNLVIGSHCLFGPNVTIWDTDNHPLSSNKRMLQAEDISKDFPLERSYEAGGGDISIEKNVWIGMDVLILGGVTIGEGAIVAARSVVTKDIPPFTIYGGIPARKIGNVPY